MVVISMGGGEIARYISNHGHLNAWPAYATSIKAIDALQAANRRHSRRHAAKSFFKDGLCIESIKKDRFAFLESFAKDFYGQSLISHPVSQAVLNWNQTVTSLAAPNATDDCVTSFSGTDFRDDLKKVTVPTLVIHGDKDQTVPFPVSGERTAKMVAGAELKVYEGAPHGLFFTEKDKLTTDLLDFLGR